MRPPLEDFGSTPCQIGHTGIMAATVEDVLNIVFISLSVSGQLNIHLATIEHMLKLGPSDCPPLRIHLVSFDPAEKRAHAIAENASASRHSVIFHGLGELTLFSETSANGMIDRHGPARLLRGGGLKPYRYLAELFGYNPDHYIRAYERIVTILAVIKPKVDVVAVDTTMPMAMDACDTAGVKWGVLCPNSGLELFKHSQPHLEGLWKHPAPYSGLPFPVPVRLIPYNIALNISLVRILFTHPKVRALESRRVKAGIRGRIFDRHFEDLPFFICSSVMDMEFPHIPPPNVVFPGPILVPIPPLAADAYPDLAAFLDRKRTIVINLGSNFWYSQEDAAHMAEAIADAQERSEEKGGFQVLWKLNGKKSFQDLLGEKFGKEHDAVRIEEWIEPPTLALLQHPNVAAFVNHGGANSVHEAAFAGVPQILLPQWLDLYEYAVRTEWLGHGIYANKGAPAQIDPFQLSDAFIRVLSDGPGEEGTLMKAKAVELSKACKRGGGVETVARTLLKAAGIAQAGKSQQ
ncbi:hypothetical protein NM688_g1330 [Phlebia brevispora]|uniref:Uncharacterized protein n=1 Tax=Phlebia brevispora TaxID=194682 RepID=A0ACC1TC42_9APHY|nr:hypothetical protein NM688_g1330 [Phlebia brevispora]